MSALRSMGSRLRAFTTPFIFCLVAVGFAAPVSHGEEEASQAIPAMILRVEGDGIAKVRKSFGTEEVAGARGQVFPGDKIITDDRSAVFLMVNDGSIVKVGLSSEFLVESAELHERFLSWAFRLVKGSMRAMVEKSPEKGTRFRVHTPSGTIGVRGTEFVVAVDEEAQTSYLYTIEGLVVYGSSVCEKDNTCVEVRAGETSSMKSGEPRANKPAPYQVKDLFGVTAQNPAHRDSRMSLFKEAKRVTSRFMQDTDDGSLGKLLLEASESMAAAQDRAIGRTKEQRLAMHQAIKDGTWDDIMAAADAFSKKQMILDPDENGGVENLVAQNAASKFRLGKALRDAREAGLFGNDKVDSKDPKVLWSKADFIIRKDVGYDKTAAAKAHRAFIERAKEDFQKTLEFTNALPPPKKNGPSTPSSNGAYNIGQGSAKNENTNAVGQENNSHCRSSRCRSSRMNGQMNAAAEGVVHAYDGKSATEKQSPGRLTRSDKGTMGTPYFRKSIPGDACYREEKECKYTPCTGFLKGKKCKKGETVMDCTVKKVPTRCPDK